MATLGTWNPKQAVAINVVDLRVGQVVSAYVINCCTGSQLTANQCAKRLKEKIKNK